MRGDQEFWSLAQTIFMYCLPASGAIDVAANVVWLSCTHCESVWAGGPRTTSTAVAGVQADRSTPTAQIRIRTLNIAGTTAA